MFHRWVFVLFIVINSFTYGQVPEDNVSETDLNEDDEDSVSDEGIVDEADDKMKEKIVTDIINNEADQAEATIVDGVPIASKNVITEVIFVHPAFIKRGSSAALELPANKPVRLLVSFANTEIETDHQNNDYKLDFIEGFLRYPSDYSYYLQNFTARPLAVVVEPTREATIEYNFVPALQLAGRPFGLTLRIGYHSTAGKLFTSTFFNETIQIIELEEGWDTESLFLYILVTAVLGLVLFGVYHLFTVYALKTFKKSGVITKSQSDSNRPMSNKDLDLEWIPAEHLKVRQSPTMSPKKRKGARNAANHMTGH